MPGLADFRKRRIASTSPHEPGPRSTLEEGRIRGRVTSWGRPVLRCRTSEVSGRGAVRWWNGAVAAEPLVLSTAPALASSGMAPAHLNGMQGVAGSNPAVPRLAARGITGQIPSAHPSLPPYRRTAPSPPLFAKQLGSLSVNTAGAIRERPALGRSYLNRTTLVGIGVAGVSSG
jgi:hypothetical protein